MQTWKTTFQRIAAMVCALALCASMVPAAVFAEPADTTEQDNGTSIVAENDNTEPATEPEEPGTEPEEPGAEPKEPGTEPEEPGTEPKEPGTEPEEPGAEPEEPGTEPEEPGTEPKEPGTEPKEPGTEPKEPAAEPKQTDSTPAVQDVTPARAPELRVAGPNASVNSKQEIFTVGYYNGAGLKKKGLTIIAVGKDGEVIDQTQAITDAYYTGSTMEITLNDAYKTQYELDSVTSEDVLVNQWTGDFVDAGKIAFTWSDTDDDPATIYLHIDEANHVLKLKNDDATVDLGTITWKEGGKQLTTVEAYLNYELVYTSRPLCISNALNNFVLEVNDGYYFDTVNMQDIKYSSSIDGQTFTYDAIDAKGNHNKLVFGLIPSTFGGTNTVKLYFFNYDNPDGLNVDFTRAINQNVVHPDLAKACDTLKISFAYKGEDYSFDYTDFSQTGAVFLPRGVNITVEPVINDGYHFEYWKTGDAWTEGNDLYTIKSDGTWTKEITGTAGLQEGRIAFSQTMGMKYSTKFDRAQIILYMTDGGLIEDPETNPNKTITYDPNYEGGPEDHIQYYYQTTGAMILDNMFPRDGYTFKGWNDKEDGTGRWYAVDSIYEGTANLTLYAQWEKVEEPEPEIPQLPDVDELNALLNVVMTCQTNAEHSKTYENLLADSYEVTTPADNACTVTVKAESYVTDMGGDHQIVGNETAMVALVYDNGWKLADGEDGTVAFTVKCETAEPEPEEPDAPTPEDLNDLLNVEMTCQTNAEHSKTYENLLADSYEVTGPADNACTVTVKAESYVTDMGGDHQMVGNETATVDLVYDNGWKLADGENGTVEFTVKCETTTEPGTPGTPTQPDLEGLGQIVTVHCDNTKAQHTDKSYNVLANSYLCGDVVTKDNEYYVSVEISADQYVAAYNKDIAEGHTLKASDANPAKQMLDLRWDAQANKWVLAEDANIQFNVICETSTEPEIPQLPGDDVISELYGENVVVTCTNADAKHPIKRYALADGSFKTAMHYEGGQYYLLVEADPASFAARYSTDTGATHSAVTTTVTPLRFNYDPATGTWSNDTSNPLTNIEVKCTTATVPGEGGDGGNGGNGGNNDQPRDEHPDIAEGIANGTWGKQHGATPTPAANAAGTAVIPQTADTLPVAQLVLAMAVAGVGALALFLLRKHSCKGDNK